MTRIGRDPNRFAPARLCSSSSGGSSVSKILPPEVPRRLGLALFIIVCVSSGSVLAPDEFDQIRRILNQNSLEYVTPHIDWAQPRAAGKPKVLFLRCFGAHTYMWHGQRDVSELAQRMDLDYTISSFWSEEGMKPTDASVRTDKPTLLGKMKEALQSDYDCIFAFDGLFGALEQFERFDLYYDILARVEEGRTNLVVYQCSETYMNLGTLLPRLRKLPDAPPEMAQEIESAAAKGLVALTGSAPSIQPRISVKMLGKGYCFFFDPSPSYSVNVWFQPAFEFEFMPLALKLIEAAAGKPSPVFVKKVPFDGITLKRTELPADIPIQLVNRTAAPIDARLELTLYDRYVFDTWPFEPYKRVLSRVESAKVTLAPGENTLSIGLPQMRSGSHLAALRVLAGDNVAGWSAGHFKVESGARVEKISSEKRAFKLANRIQAKVECSGVAEGMELRLRLLDIYGRLHEESRTAAAPTMDFEFAGPTGAGWLFRIEALLAGQDGLELSLGYAEVTCPEARERDDFFSLCWGGLNSPMVYPIFMLERLVRDEFIDDVYLIGIGQGQPESEGAALWQGRFGIGASPYTMHLAGTMEHLLDENFRQKTAAALQAGARTLSPYAPRIYSLGNEVGHDRNPEKIPPQAFREWLKQKHGGVDTLNAAWKKAIKAWEEIIPITRETMVKEKLRAQWMEQETFMDHVWVDTVRYLSNAIKEIEPSARVGYEGSSMYDCAKLLSVVEYMGPYYSVEENAKLRSFARPGSVIGNWWGAAFGTSAQAHRVLPWRSLFEGMNSSEYYYIGGMFHPSMDLTLSAAAQAASDQVRELRSGAGKLIMGSEYVEDGVALYYSRASEFASEIVATLSNRESSSLGFHHLLSDAGFQYRWVDSRAVSEGKLDPKTVKALILPYTQAVSKKEAEALEQFAQNGGTVIADIRAGAMNELGFEAEKGQLDSLFGISMKPEQSKPVNGTLHLEAEYRGSLLNLSFETIADAAVALSEGKALATLDGRPVMVCRDLGLGRAIFFNFYIGRYLQFRSIGKGDEFRNFIRALLASTGVKPEVRLEGKGKPYAEEVILSRFRSGDNFFLGLTTADQPTSPIELKLPEARHLTNVRDGKYLGRADSFSLDVEPLQAYLFAATPYQVKSVSLSPKSSQAAPGQLLPFHGAIETDGPRPGAHVLHLRLIGPDGQKVLGFRKNAEAPSGQFTGNLHFALNDPAGRWRLWAKDVISGIEASADIELK